MILCMKKSRWANLDLWFGSLNHFWAPLVKTIPNQTIYYRESWRKGEVTTKPFNCPLITSGPHRQTKRWHHSIIPRKLEGFPEREVYLHGSKVFSILAGQAKFWSCAYRVLCPYMKTLYQKFEKKDKIKPYFCFIQYGPSHSINFDENILHHWIVTMINCCCSGKNLEAVMIYWPE